jgi:ubiquinone/menaquinone biosynthesis C-methylase UbiE
MNFKGKVLGVARKIAEQNGYDIVKKGNNQRKDYKAEAHPGYKKEAEQLGIDINDYQESKLGFVDSLPLLKEIVFPLIENLSKPFIIELGPGTGRWSRHILKKLEEKDGSELMLVDHSSWIVDFLNDYFKGRSKVKFSAAKCDGFILPPEIKDSSADLIFSSNTFVALGIYFYYTYSHDFFRVLKKGGYCVFDFIDLNSEGGWNFLLQKTGEKLNYYAYYTFEAVDKVFRNSGFEFCSKYLYGKSTYLIYRKSS